MPLHPLTPTDTRALFRPVSAALVALLRELPAADWDRPTIAGTWGVRDVVAHLLDVTCRRLSFHRDGLIPEPPPQPIASPLDFTAFINGLNAQWIAATRRVSPRVLTDLFARASGDLADFVEGLPLDAPALFAVSWAGEGEDSSAGWFDIGREFTELWHHQEQIRLAVGAPSLADPRYLHAVLAIAVRGLPHAYRDLRPGALDAIVIEITGDAGGTWTLAAEDRRWVLFRGDAPAPSTRIRLSDTAAWMLLFNGLRDQQARDSLQIDGDRDLAGPLFHARSVIA